MRSLLRKAKYSCWEFVNGCEL